MQCNVMLSTSREHEKINEKQTENIQTIQMKCDIVNE